MDVKLIINNDDGETTTEEIHRDFLTLRKNLETLTNDKEGLRVINEVPDGISNMESRCNGVELTTIAVEFFAGGAAVALINLISNFSVRMRTSKMSYDIKITDKKGEVTFEGDHLSHEQANDILKTLSELSGVLKVKLLKKTKK